MVMSCCSVPSLRVIGVSLLAVSSPSLAACRSAVAPVALEAASASAEASGAPVDDARGGRLYDAWYAELDLGFIPGSRGGPHGDGTLDNGRGEVMVDDGHGYRLKNLFGWDLRGADGIYGPRYQNKPFVRSTNLLADGRSVEEVAAWLEQGDDETPRFGAVLPREAIEELAVFIVSVRTGELPRPDEIWDLAESAPQSYVLRPGADAERGAERIVRHCGCHGSTGLEVIIDDAYSLGSFARTKGYEAWFKVLNGHPGSEMGRELDVSRRSDSDDAAQILEILAALCDRTRFPAIEGNADVPEGDAGCGSYLR